MPIWVLAWTFRHGWLTISLGLASVAVSLVLATQLKLRMVPFADRDQFAVEIYLRPDAPLERTAAVADSVYRVLHDDARVKSVTSFVGCSSPRFQMSYAPQIAGKNYAQFIINTTSVDDTEDILDQYADAWADRFPEAYVKFKQLDYQNVPSLEFRFYGSDIDSLRAAADRLMARMRQMPELQWVHSDYEDPRAIVEVDEINNRQCLVITDLPYQVNPDRLVVSIREAVRDGKIQGIADMRDETSGRTGQRLVLVLKRDAVPKVVLNNLYKHSQLQQTFGANMLALVDGVPRTLSLDAFIRHWVNHQLDVIARRTAYLKREAEERDHILQGYLKALDMIDEVIALIRASESAETARTGLMDLLDVDEVQADAILAMQLRRLAALERQKILDEHNELMRKIADYIDILAKPERQRKIIGDELDEIVAKYGDDRRTKILPFSGEMNVEDLIAEENVVVTVTHSGFIKRTKADEYRAQHRGGKGIKGAKLREDDVVDHFFLTSTHNWLLFFTNKGRVYRLKAYELPEGSRDSKGQHVANLLQFGPDETIQTVLSIPNYDVAKYLVLATRSGKVKKTALAEYDSPRQGGLIAVRLMTDENGENADELIGAALCNADDDIILVSKQGMSLKFEANDEQLRPMGRQTAGVQGMKFRNDDSLLAMDVVPGDSDKDLFVVTNEGFAKRTAISEYRLQGRNGLGIKAVQLVEGRGALVGALVVSEDDQVMAIMKSGKVIRSNVDEVKRTGRNTQGVTFAKPDKGDTILSIARNEEKDEPEDGGDAAANGTAETAQSGENVNNADEA